MNVVATAGIGTNPVTIITLTDVKFLKMERWARLNPEQIESCLEDVKAQGMLRREWTIINCLDLSVTSSNQPISEPITHRIAPQVAPLVPFYVRTGSL